MRYRYRYSPLLPEIAPLALKWPKFKRDSGSGAIMRYRGTALIKLYKYTPLLISYCVDNQNSLHAFREIMNLDAIVN